MRRRKSPYPLIFMAALVLCVAIGGWLAFSRYVAPTVDMSSIDAMNASVTQVGRLMGDRDRNRLEFLYAKNKAGIAMQIVFLRAGGGTGDYQGMTGEQFLAAMEQEWQRNQEMMRAISGETPETIRAVANREAERIEAEFDSLAREARTPEDVDSIRDEIKKRAAKVRGDAELKIKKLGIQQPPAEGKE